jgi:hypothetical protein
MTEEEQEGAALDLDGLGAAAAAAAAASDRDAFIKSHAAEIDDTNQVRDDDDDDTLDLGDDSDSDSSTTDTDTAEASEEDKDNKKVRKPRKKRTQTPETTSLFVRSGYMFLLHMFCIAIYLIPILSNSEYNRGEPVLDELHITQASNQDVNGETTLRTIFTNDYWGRPMQSASRYVNLFFSHSM